MKKFASTIIIFILVLCNIHAEELFPDTNLRIKERSFEIGYNLNIVLSNNLITAQNFLQERMVLDFDNLGGSLNIHTGMSYTPFFINIRTEKGGGWGLSLNTNVFGSFALSEKIFTFSEADGEKSDSGFAVFTDVSMDFIFKIEYFKIKIKPSVFLPVMYTRPEIVYTFDTTGESNLSLEYDAQIYTALKIDDIDNIKLGLNSFTTVPGVDFSISVEYPLSRAIGIFKKFALFDFDVGIDLLNIPLNPSTMNHYIRMTGNITLEGDKIESFLKPDISKDFSYGEDKKKVFRPFRTILWADWRLFGNHLFTISPHFGFSINLLYIEPFSPEYGLQLKLDLANIFAISLGTRYEDRFWKTGTNILLNLEIVEFNIGAAVSSKEFLDVPSIGGVGIYIGLKIGL